MGALLLLSGCGVSPRADDAVAFPRWTATGFEDSFSGPAGTAPDGSRWTLERGGWGWGNTELQCFTADPANVSLDGQGHLRIVARKEGVACADGRSNQYTSARLTTAGTYSFHYGRIEVRAKLPGGRGLLPVIWALGDDFDRVGWPASGEIDVAEVLGSDPSTVYGTLHGAGADAPWQFQNRHQADLPLNEGFHVYAAEWGPDGLRFLLDGRQYGRVLSLTNLNLPAGARWPFDKPFHLLMSLSVGNVWEGPPNSDEVFPAEMLIDWVRVLRP